MGLLRAAGRIALEITFVVLGPAFGDRLPGEGVRGEGLPVPLRRVRFSGGISVVWPILQPQHWDDTD